MNISDENAARFCRKQQPPPVRGWFSARVGKEALFPQTRARAHLSMNLCSSPSRQRTLGPVSAGHQQARSRSRRRDCRSPSSPPAGWPCHRSSRNVPAKETTCTSVRQGANSSVPWGNCGGIMPGRNDKCYDTVPCFRINRCCHCKPFIVVWSRGTSWRHKEWRQQETTRKGARQTRVVA